MKLTTEEIAIYIGGQMELQKETEGLSYRGQIKDIWLAGERLFINFDWMAQGTSQRPGWVASRRMDVFVNLEACYEPDLVNRSLCLCIISPFTGERFYLYPPGQSGLDPSTVFGLGIPS